MQEQDERFAKRPRHGDDDKTNESGNNNTINNNNNNNQRMMNSTINSQLLLTGGGADAVGNANYNYSTAGSSAMNNNTYNSNNNNDSGNMGGNLFHTNQLNAASTTAGTMMMMMMMNHHHRQNATATAAGGGSVDGNPNSMNLNNNNNNNNNNSNTMLTTVNRNAVDGQTKIAPGATSTNSTRGSTFTNANAFMGGMNNMNMNMNMHPLMMRAAGMIGTPDEQIAAALYLTGNHHNRAMANSNSNSNYNNNNNAAAAAATTTTSNTSTRISTDLSGGFMRGAVVGNPYGDCNRLTSSQNPYLTGLSNSVTVSSTNNSYPTGSIMGGNGTANNNSRHAQLMAIWNLQQQQPQPQPSELTCPGSDFNGTNSLVNHHYTSNNISNNNTAAWAPMEAPVVVDSNDNKNNSSIPTFSSASTPAVQPLPPIIEDGVASHFGQRNHIPLGIDEDNNWLTEFQCFIRYDLIEVIQASRHIDQLDGTNGNNGKQNSSDSNGTGDFSGESYVQVGIRCRYCAHLHPGQRTSRSSAFPSSIRQLYQSFTMMLRDHFEQCSEIPPARKKLFAGLKAKNSQGAYDSKQYWVYAAGKLGMVDSHHGIQITAESQAKARHMPPFGTVDKAQPVVANGPPKLLVSPEDIRITSDFLYTLMSQVQVVHLIESERVGKRKTLCVGLPGFGCRYCCHVGRCGLSRMFPLRRRMLPGKVNEIYEHVKRCTLFPAKEKDLLARLKLDDRTSPEQEKEFFDRIWERLGNESEVKK